ncbi:glycoprotein hormone beta-5 [Tachysurus vachellii]|uniref:glycoprotein hormone beta-5 n=1 Tax=Tachysurus vachellii TaxID=175792 RepID=UPI00296AD48A|nr:glycoprotein hormone beta-5 [Tachysurus vachellii]
MAFRRSQTLRLSETSLCCAVVCVLLCLSHRSHVSAVNLQHFIGCSVREFTFMAQKPGCGRLQITTDACWGRCETWEKPVLDPPFIESHQRVCTYNQTQLVTVQLPNCSSGMDPYYTYPVALRCECGVCVTSTTECIASI